jgi:NTE family protein
MPRNRKPVPIDLALQGGGSHGAFTWGVLDRLLEDETLAFDGVSGTSAGALNAAVLATGLAEGGRAGARAALRAFWMDVATAGGCFGAAQPPLAALGAAQLPLAAFGAAWSPALFWLQQFMHAFSPYQFNPLDINPLRHVLERHVRPAALARAPVSLFVTATSVHTGQPRVFERRDLTIDALLASACLPHLFRAVTIDGEPYWDGGYTGNPALWPLIYHTAALDILLVQINPLERRGTPTTRMEIDDRLSEITFNAALVGEMRAIAFVHKLVAEGRIDPGEYKDLRLHRVAEPKLGALNASSKLLTDRAFLLELHALGRAAAGRWLEEHRGAVGRRGTLDPRAGYLARGRRTR